MRRTKKKRREITSACKYFASASKCRMESTRHDANTEITINSKWSMSRRQDTLSRRGQEPRIVEKRRDEANNTRAKWSVGNRANRRIMSSHKPRGVWYTVDSWRNWSGATNSRFPRSYKQHKDCVCMCVCSHVLLITNNTLVLKLTFKTKIIPALFL